ncbi:MAG: hypothetical protein OEX12_16055 [Gammaproteobacteria bacterium]|nr:hypothetical protein [Gammaproteobacteria bacterium]
MMATRDGAGVPQGLRPIGNVPELSLGIEISTEDHKESYSGARGVDKTSTTETAVSASITFESIDPENLVLGINGTFTDVVAAVGATHTVQLFLGKWTALDYLNVSNVSIPDDGVGTLVIDVDYELDAAHGLIKLLSNTNKADGVNTIVTYDHAQTYNLEALTASNPERYFIFSGLNTEDDKPVRLEIPRLQTTPFSDLPMINDGIGTFSLEATALADPFIVDAGKSKYFREILGA